MRVDGKAVVVTGASRGLGRRMAVDFAAAGALVALASRDMAALEEVTAEIRAKNGRALAVRCDVTREPDCEHLMAQTEEAFGRIDVLVNNAGIAGPTKLVVDVQLEEWEEVLRTNLTAPYLCIRHAVKRMMARSSGAIVNIASAIGKRPLAQRSPYAASKLGLVGLTRTLAQELGPYGIRVNAIMPGPVEGPRMNSVIEAMAKARGVTQEEVREFFTKDSPLGVMIQDSDISSMALYLASDLGRHMTGQDINVTAGRMMY